MRTLVFVLLSYTLAFAVLPGCAGQPINWPSTVKCAGPITGALVQEVENILINGSGTGMNIGEAAIAALEKLAKEHGAELVSCVIEQFITNTMRPGGAELSTVKASAAARAQDFLNRKGVSVLTTQSTPPAP